MTFKKFKSDAERVARYKVTPSGCWEWTGHVIWNGYGKLYPVQGEYLAHRASYVLHNGPIPAGKLVLHSCDNRLCINPAHLSVGDHSQNQREAYQRGRRPTYNGAANANAKLTEQDVIAILSDQRTQQAIADSYGVSTSLISAIRRGNAWKHVERTANATERARINLR